MNQPPSSKLDLPSPAQLRAAITAYLELAYGQQVPAAAARFLPDGQADVERWLMADLIERDPPHAPLEAVRSFALRIGNTIYPHMKLRLSRPPRDRVFLFSVDSHDAFLHATPNTQEYAALEGLKKHNASLAARIASAWDEAGLPTERNYLRGKVRLARDLAQDGDIDIPPRTPPPGNGSRK